MNYDIRLDVCKRIRELDYNPRSKHKLLDEIKYSQEFNPDEKIRLITLVENRSVYGFSDRNSFLSPENVTMCILAGAAGYVARVLQDVMKVSEDEGIEIARNKFLTAAAKSPESTRTSS